ncbi:MAG: AI-2E family transporter [Eubacteriales bacterium]|nr:AI-2E family transporter [Eubacteriales bacterium]
MKERFGKNPFVISAFSIALFFLLYNGKWFWSVLSGLLGILMPFVLGLAIAFILSVPMRFLEGRVLRGFDKNKRLKRLKRPASLLIVLAILAGIVYLLISLIVPEIQRALGSIFHAMPAFLSGINEKLLAAGIDLSGLFQNASGSAMNETQLRQQLEQWLNLLWNGAMASTSVLAGLYQNVMSLFFTFMFALYGLFSKERLGVQARKLLYAYAPEKAAGRTMEICRLANKTFCAFITGQCTEALILGGMFFVAMTIFRFPYALLIGVLIAVTALIPIIGAWIGCATGALLMLMSSPAQAVWFVILFLLLQQIEGNLIYPHVMGGAIGLPPLWVLLAVVVGEGLLGVVGMLLSIPTFSVLYALLRENANRRLREKHIDQEIIKS